MLPGQWFQLESGLHYNWHRHYDPTTGRYLQADPLGLEAGISRWAYAANSPLMNVDREGRYWQLALPVITGGGNLAYQLWQNDGNWNCVNWWQVGEWALIGIPGPVSGLKVGASITPRLTWILSRSGRALDHSDTARQLSMAGRSLQKHGSRPGSVFPPARGNPQSINQQGQAELVSRLSNPSARVTRIDNRFGGIDVNSPAGGARFDRFGQFRNFLEPE